eukprot:gene12201-16344_t
MSSLSPIAVPPLSPLSLVKGVETNESSRFIDHTFATPWESFVSDIENALKQLLSPGTTVNGAGTNSPIGNNRESKLENHKIEIIYLGLSYIIQKKKIEFKVDNITMNQNNNYNIQFDDWFAQCKEIFGWFNATNNNSISSLLSLESYLNDKITQQHPLYFFDGLKKVFEKKKYSLLSYQLMNNLSILTNTSRNEDEDITHNNKRIFEQYIVSSEDLYQYYLSDVKHLFHNPHKNQSNHSSFHQDFNWMYKPLFNHDFDLFLRKLTGSPNQSDIAMLRLSTVSIIIKYNYQQQSYIIDNENYTTFSPSKLPPKNWSVKTEFDKINEPKLNNSINNNNNSNNINNNYTNDNNDVHDNHIFWMAKCIRKLLALYLSSLHLHNNNNLRSKSLTINKLVASNVPLEELFSSSSLLQATEMLSIPSKVEIQNLCPFLKTATINNDNNMKQKTRNLSNSSQILSNNSSKAVSSDEEYTHFGKLSRTPSLTPSSNNNSNNGQDLDFSNIDIEYATILNDTMNFLHRNADVNHCFVSYENELNGADNNNKSDSIGHWLNIYAISSGLSNGSIKNVAKLWMDCLSELHGCWENDYPIKQFPTMHHRSGNQSFVNDDYSLLFVSELNKIHLNHIIDRMKIKYEHNNYIQFDSNGNINNNQCNNNNNNNNNNNLNINMMYNEDHLPIYSRFLWNDLLIKKVEQGITINLPSTYESVLVQKLQLLQFCIVMKNDDVIYKSKYYNNNNSNYKNDNSVIIIPSTNGNRIIIPPELYRRLPLTTDKIIQNKKLESKINSSSSSAKDRPSLKLQIKMPYLVSDIKAFKAANNKGTLEDFCHCPELKEIWDNNEPATCQSQPSKPPFQAEKEAENYSIAGLIEILENIAIKSDHLQQIFQPLHSLTGPINDNNNNNNNDNNVDNQSLLYRFRMINNLCQYSSHTMEENDNFDVMTIMNLIKSLRSNNNYIKSAAKQHDWHSYDGRELGFPTSKKFKALQPYPVKTDRMNSNNTDNNNNDNNKDDKNDKIEIGSINNDKYLLEMNAIIDNYHKLRVSFITHANELNDDM